MIYRSNGRQFSVATKYQYENYEVNIDLISPADDERVYYEFEIYEHSTERTWKGTFNSEKFKITEPLDAVDCVKEIVDKLHAKANLVISQRQKLAVSLLDDAKTIIKM